MKIVIQTDRQMQSGKPYCAVNFLSGFQVTQWSEEFNANIKFEREYNFAFELPDVFINNNINDQLKILNNIEIGINEILRLFNDEFKLKELHNEKTRKSK